MYSNIIPPSSRHTNTATNVIRKAPQPQPQPRQQQVNPPQQPQLKPPQPPQQAGAKPTQTSSEDNQLIVTALKKYIQIVNEMRDLRTELKKREDIRAKLAPILIEYMDKIDQKKIKTVQDTLTYTTYKSLEGYSKKSVQRLATQFFQNQRKAEEFMEFCEKHRQTVERKGLKHTKPRARKTKIVKVKK